MVHICLYRYLDSLYFQIRPIIANNNFVIADRFYTDIWANLFIMVIVQLGLSNFL